MKFEISGGEAIIPLVPPVPLQLHHMSWLSSDLIHFPYKEVYYFYTVHVSLTKWETSIVTFGQREHVLIV